MSCTSYPALDVTQSCFLLNNHNFYINQLSSVINGHVLKRNKFSLTKNNLSNTTVQHSNSNFPTRTRQIKDVSSSSHPFYTSQSSFSINNHPFYINQPSSSISNHLFNTNQPSSTRSHAYNIDQCFSLTKNQPRFLPHYFPHKHTHTKEIELESSEPSQSCSNKAKTTIPKPETNSKNLEDYHLKVSFLNARSIANKLSHFFNYVQSSKQDIFFVTESWLKPYHLDSLVCPTGYQVIRNDRLKQMGGGVLVLFKEQLNVVQVALKDPTFEYICIDLIVSKKSLPIFFVFNYHQTTHSIKRE